MSVFFTALLVGTGEGALVLKQVGLGDDDDLDVDGLLSRLPVCFQVGNLIASCSACLETPSFLDAWAMV